MADSENITLLLGRVRDGDPAARSELFTALYLRLTKLTATFLRSFPGAAARHDVESIVHDVYLKLIAAFDGGHVPAESAGFFRFAAHKLRCLLLDEADKARVRRATAAAGGEEPSTDPGTSTWEPGALAEWTEFHRQVGDLPEAEREVMELCFYLGMSQAEAAAQLGLHPRTVSRLVGSAVGKLTAPD
jgi:RNA polymerase sigma factor (sigma-70 family)